MAAFPHKRHEPRNVHQLHRNSLGLQDRIAMLITGAVGTMYAVYFFTLAIAGWMLWQGYITNKPFDPYPFAFLLFLGNIVQLLLMPLIMVGQNIQGRHAQIRDEEEYHTTVSSYKDIEHILERIGAQDEELLQQTKILKLLEKSTRK